MKIWMSSEEQLDVGDEYRIVRQKIESEVNQHLELIKLSTKAKKWVFIAIIMQYEDSDYPEVKKWDSRRGVLEFRLKINYYEFKNASFSERMNLVVNALLRTVEYMPKFGVTYEDCEKLKAILLPLQNESTTI